MGRIKKGKENGELNEPVRNPEKNQLHCNESADHDKLPRWTIFGSSPGVDCFIPFTFL